ncbi:CRISPR-associated endonuclease Cas2 [Proteiniclasticum sp. BAD-10]|uniref:CRISPR-associated endoribonuclease Cas2 n=1 Tax=Proteiniclasticum sediminis TaxID=2804028 RepID=A0A941HR30_9CLOT|nr:CRISPR-associated endonuclease Cas2 [Proteiniclasticum sediminis]MBR0577139.1 CRISPR-associated endonuclease Cas2 [Proteiniclasticum sediminis]
MLVLITYDVSTVSTGGASRLRRIAKQCTNYGQRVQYSVFECVVDAGQLELLKNKLLKIMDDNHDSLRLYILGNNYKSKVEHYGVKYVENIEEPLIL